MACRLTLLAMTLITTPFGFDSTATEVVAGGTGVAAYALNLANAHRLWDLSEALLNRA
jgi:hypothetical protein